MFFIFFIDADLKQFKLNFNSVLLSERVNRIDIFSRSQNSIHITAIENRIASGSVFPNLFFFELIKKILLNIKCSPIILNISFKIKINCNKFSKVNT